VAVSWSWSKEEAHFAKSVSSSPVVAISMAAPAGKPEISCAKYRSWFLPAVAGASRTMP
jgi:hypothetical protein